MKYRIIVPAPTLMLNNFLTTERMVMELRDFSKDLSDYFGCHNLTTRWLTFFSMVGFLDFYKNIMMTFLQGKLMLLQHIIINENHWEALMALCTFLMTSSWDRSKKQIGGYFDFIRFFCTKTTKIIIFTNELFSMIITRKKRIKHGLLTFLAPAREALQWI